MERYRLKDDIWWVGAIDWNLRDFHGYETPRGTTYNAYLITDEKMTVVDTVRAGFGPEMLQRLRGCCDLSKLDYLVVNHIEMDHSGSLAWFLEQVGPVTIFCSKRAKDGLALLYGDQVAGWDIKVVGTGDELSLGRYTLTFLEAPMLHWPDSMFTYIKEAKVLLPNDGFGQHLATSKRFADEVDMSVVMDEASTYYANILMPYGAQVKKMLDKIAELGLEIDIIGPSHGVIWRRPQDIQGIIEAYARWSVFEAPPRVALIFDTMWHSTEMMTRALEDGIAQEGVACDVVRLSRSSLAQAVRLVLESRAFLVGTPTLNNGMFPPVGAFLTYLKGLRPKERLAAAYGSYGWGGGGAKQVDAELRAMGLEVLDPLEFKFVPTVADLDVCEAYGRDVARRAKAWGA